MRNTLKKSQNALQNLELLLGVSATGSSKMSNAKELQERLQRALRQQEEREEHSPERILVICAVVEESALLLISLIIYHSKG